MRKPASFVVAVLATLASACGSQPDAAKRVTSDPAPEAASSSAAAPVLECPSQRTLHGFLSSDAKGMPSPVDAAAQSLPPETFSTEVTQVEARRVIVTAYDASRTAIAQVTTVHRNASWLMQSATHCN